MIYNTSTHTYTHTHNGILLLLLLSYFSCVRLCETPETAAHQAPPSLGFSRQEHWSGLPLPSPMRESEKWKWSRSVMSDSSWLHGLQPTRLLHPWDSPGKGTGVGCHRLLPMKYYSSIKKKEIMPFAAPWIDLEIIIVSGVSQRNANNVSLRCGI